MSTPYYSIHTGSAVDTAVTDTPLLRTAMDLLILPNAFIGGAAGALDAVLTSSRAVGARATVYKDRLFSPYELVAGTDTEDSPVIVRPDDYAGGTNEKVWKLQGGLFERIGVGIVPVHPVHVKHTVTTGGNARSANFATDYSNTAPAASTVRGVEMGLVLRDAELTSTTPGLVSAVYGYASTAGSGGQPVARMEGVTGLAGSGSTGTVTDLIGVQAYTLRAAGAVTSAYGFRHNHVGDVTNLYGIHLSTPTSGTITNRWGIYQEDPTANNYFEGQIGLGVTPTFPLHVRHTKTDGGSANSAYFVTDYSTTAPDGGSVRGVNMALSLLDAELTATTVGAISGIYASVTTGVTGTSTITRMAAVTGLVGSSGTGTVTTGIGIQAYTLRSAGTLTNAYGFRHDHVGDATTLYGIYLATPVSGTITTRWGIYQEDPLAGSFYAGHIVMGFGAQSLGAFLTIRRSMTSSATGWSQVTVGSAALTAAGNLSCVAVAAVANSAGLAANVTGETATHLGVCSVYCNPNHTTATHSLSLLQGVRISAQHISGAGAIVTFVGLDCTMQFSSAAGVTNGYGILLRSRVGTNVTNYHPIFQEDTAGSNLFAALTRIQNYFGSQWIYEGAVVVTVSATGTWYEVTTGWTLCHVAGVTQVASHALAVSVAGKYLVKWQVSCSTASNNQVLLGAFMINGSATTSGTAQMKIGIASDIQSFSGFCILNLAANDEVSVAVRNDTATSNITVRHANLSILRVGT